MVAKKNVTYRGDKIIYNYKGIKYYFTYNEILFKILKLRSVCPSVDSRNGGKRLTLVTDHTGGNRFKFYAYYLAYACYHGHIKTEENFEEELKIFKAYMIEQGLVVDHLNDDIFNNSVYNLSLMDKALNLRKSTVVSRYKYPSSVVCSYVSGQYRLVFTQTVNKHTEEALTSMLGIKCPEGSITAEMYLICSSPEKVVNCLCELSTTDIDFVNELRGKGGKWLNRTAKDWTQDSEKAIEAQKRVAELPETKFNIYENKMNTLKLTAIKGISVLEN